MIEHLLTCCLVGLGIWGMRRFGAGVCLGYDESFNYLTADYWPEPCLVSSRVRVTIAGTIAWISENTGAPDFEFDPNGQCNSACGLATEPDPADHPCVLQYYGVHECVRATSGESAPDLCRDGDESTPIRYEKVLTPICTTENNVTLLTVKSISKSTASGKPRVVVLFEQQPGNTPYGIQKHRDLDRRIVCGAEGRDLAVTVQSSALDSPCCLFESDDTGYPGLPPAVVGNITVEVDFSGLP